jgi:dTDP-glucose 4,6-dehydratase
LKRLLITGGAGFIGANFCHHWSAAHPADRLVVLDALTYAGNLASIAPLLETGRVHFVRGDIGDRARVARLLAEERIDTIVNFAAESHVDRSIEDPQAFLRTNIMGTHALLEAARSAWPDADKDYYRFHHVSTDEVYGSLEPTDPAFTEQTAYAPNSPYSASKAAADHLVRAYAHTYGLPCTISNCSNNYGPYQFPEKILPLCILNILESRPLPVYGDGQQIRDWLHVSDHCRAIELILNASPAGQTWNIGGSSGHCNLKIVETLCDLVDAMLIDCPELAGRYPRSTVARGAGTSRRLIRHVRDRPGHDHRYAVDGSKIARLGFEVMTRLEEGLASTVRWYLQNESWWRAILSGEYSGWCTRQYGGKLPALVEA